MLTALAVIEAQTFNLANTPLFCQTACYMQPYFFLALLLIDVGKPMIVRAGSLARLALERRLCVPCQCAWLLNC